MKHLKTRRGSSLVYLGFSIIIFVISYGIIWLLVPAILGAFFSIDIPIADPEWAATYESNQDVIRGLIAFVPSMGILVLVIKVLMVASVRGSD